MTEITLGGYKPQSAEKAVERISMMLWGSSGCGKTTFAATAPGPVLMLQFDPGGNKSITNAPNLEVIDLSGEDPRVTDKLKKENPLGIEQYIKEKGIKTVILDSLTTLSNLCIENALKYGSPSIGMYKGASLETPGMQVYGHRINQVLEIVKQFQRSTLRTGANIIYIAHEAAPKEDDKGVVIYISIMLGGNIPEYSALNLDEVWFMSDIGKEHRITVRPGRMRKPMKTRLFDTANGIEFPWRFNPIKWEGDTLASIIDKYREAGGKIPLPK